jgi:uncharacterized membrane protein
MKNQETIPCCLCKKPFTKDRLISGYGIRKELEVIIQSEYPEWNDRCFICQEDYRRIRKAYVLQLVGEEQGKIETLERVVIDSIHENEMLSLDASKSNVEKLTFGSKLADGVAKFGGSWTFIISFFLILIGWIALNTFVLVSKPFDPYPYILLNLVLSCLAAIQAPIIMMSQNRQESKDRIRSENDYKVNLKSEIEIRTLHEKMDHLMLDQWSKMMDIQQIQMDMIEEMSKKAGK